MKTNSQHLARINDLLVQYKQEIEGTTMKPLSKKTYTIHAQNFVRWISGEFVPGGNLNTKQITETGIVD
ncbi:hypothetical protein [Dyadobacter sp. CY356]|uniref:hypothetical protein n=1 Tax=Dyadobacter sp. CY356 TaxID=2906442 RepID=UPI001F201375|nr:hypothetical protein [Dyadobacter sp. CY356]MCF0055132.1 hypothetical protein [Dyadobacter sp. CY356]